MDYEVIDSSGTDDDFPQAQYSQVPAGSFLTGGLIGSGPYQRTQSDMESQIHFLEQEAYGAILRAFKAQSDALTWEKEGLITELRKELRVSDDEHRELLTKVNSDELIRRIREWRKAGCPMLNVSQPGHDQLPSPTVSASRKKQKTSLSVTIPYGAAPHSLHTPSVAGTPHQPSSAGKWGSPALSGGMRPKPGPQSFSSAKPMQYQATPRGSSGAPFTNDHSERTRDPLVGRKVMTRWPEDDNFYEAVIADYNPLDGRHALVYDRDTTKETWEWVHLNEIPSVDIRWVGDDPGISRLGVGGRPAGAVDFPSVGRGRESLLDQSDMDVEPSQNGVVKKISDNMEILHTDTLIEKIEKVLGSSHPDLHEIEKAKKLLKEHEQSLIDVIAKLADACDNGGGNETLLVGA